MITLLVISVHILIRNHRETHHKLQILTLCCKGVKKKIAFVKLGKTLTSLPVFAIGGIQIGQVGDVMEAGADGEIGRAHV